MTATHNTRTRHGARGARRVTLQAIAERAIRAAIGTGADPDADRDMALDAAWEALAEAGADTESGTAMDAFEAAWRATIGK